MLNNLNFGIACPVATEEEIEAFESSELLKLPSELKEFYLRFNGGSPDESNEQFRVPKRFAPYHAEYGGEGISLSAVYGLMPASERFSCIKKMEFLRKMRNLPANLIPIAGDASGNMVFLDCADEKYGRLDFWDNETEIFYQIADGCAEFFNSLEAP